MQPFYTYISLTLFLYTLALTLFAGFGFLPFYAPIGAFLGALLFARYNAHLYHSRATSVEDHESFYLKNYFRKDYPIEIAVALAISFAFAVVAFVGFTFMSLLSAFVFSYALTLLTEYLFAHHHHLRP